MKLPSEGFFFSISVVTGCSKGIGLNYAHELAKKGMNLVLIARKANLLNEIADDIKSKYGVEVDVIIADFGKGNDIYKNIEESLVGKRFLKKGIQQLSILVKFYPILTPPPAPSSSGHLCTWCKTYSLYT